MQKFYVLLGLAFVLASALFPSCKKQNNKEVTSALKQVASALQQINVQLASLQKEVDDLKTKAEEKRSDTEKIVKSFQQISDSLDELDEALTNINRTLPELEKKIEDLKAKQPQVKSKKEKPQPVAKLAAKRTNKASVVNEKPNSPQTKTETPKSTQSTSTLVKTEQTEQKRSESAKQEEESAAQTTETRQQEEKKEYPEPVLSLVSAKIALKIDRKKRQPVDVMNVIPAGVHRVYCWMVLSNKSSKEQQATAVWIRNGKEVARVQLRVGPSAGTWRTWAYLTLRSKGIGDWKVAIYDPGGAKIGEVPFKIVEKEK